MRSLLTLPSIALLGLGVGACGEAGKRTGSASRSSSSAAAAAAATTLAQSRLPTDRDEDSPVLRFGYAASLAEVRAIASLVRRYYGDGAAGDGASACSLLYSLLRESVVEEYAQSPGLRGKTCAEVLSKLFKRRHRDLAGDVAALKLTIVRVGGDRGLALVRFGATRERRVLVRRERGAWKMGVLLDVGVS
jgi:hypothetical protein